MASHPIGTITIADGIVVIQRNNQLIELQEGDSIYLNDIIEAKSGSVGLTFTDQTTFSIDAGSQVVVDEFVYDPGNTGSMNINVLAGNFSYISGEISKMDGDVEIVTPTASITAFITAAGAAIVPASPHPLTPKGLEVAGVQV